MHITPSKSKLAVAVLAAALLIPATAFAAGTFDDVPDGKFYAEPVEWAADNNITTGKTATTFAPDDPVTRGESVTFLKRYNDNIVDPALEALESDIDDLEAAAPTTYWAWVNSSGAVYTDKSSDGVSASSSGTGTYAVTFPEDVTGCSWTVSHRAVNGIIIIDADYASPAIFRLSTRSSGFFPNIEYFNEDILVNSYNVDGDLKNTTFNLEVTCFPS